MHGTLSGQLGSTHTPVLLRECLAMLNARPGGRYVDCTIGTGGHAIAIAERIVPGGRLLGIDLDPKAIEAARERLRPYSEHVVLVNDNFANLGEVCARYDFRSVDGILLDLGVCSLQLDDATRGFSFRFDAPLDMRFGPAQPITAAALLNQLSANEIADLLWRYGEERRSRRIASRIVASRPINTTAQLAHIAEQAVGRGGRLHPATRTFQALRIAVNKELTNLEEALRQTIGLLSPGGRLVVISYHSLEDRLVKTFLQQESRHCLCPPGVPVCCCGHRAALKVITRRVITPSDEEKQSNPRARSARLRAAERL